MVVPVGAVREASITEAEWLAFADPEPMLEFLRGKVSDRQLRLFACACCRRRWNMLADARSRRAVKVAERYADGNATVEELNDARREAIEVANNLTAPPGLRRAERVKLIAYAAGRAASWGQEALTWAGEMAHPLTQNKLIRCIFGNPFRPVSLKPEWLAWNDRTIPKLAQAIYDERAFDRLPILADALEEAGCDNADVLAHCRGEGPHVRGCWVVDLLLGKA